jgi:hypothetical protein
VSQDTERLLELAGEIGQRLSGALGDMVPPDARQHLLNAQKELLTALFLIYEHQVGARRTPAGAPPSFDEQEPEEDTRPAPSRRGSRRISRIEVE